ncbi:hypothetical protein BRARA_G01004 [Brassica rapa]|uniref:Uncharacterized protein n=1 Tax=Brassica campestris TaxID=3711 RepID=A0A397YJK5_BRACM|nr:hypothetical protein BRARA_G01004 [Brassica rapa]
MTNEENKNSSSSPPAKRPKKCSNCPGAKVYTSSRAEYKSMVRRLTCTLPGSSGQTSLRVSTQAQVSNPQPIRLNDASIPPGSSGQTSLRVTTQARVSNPQPIRLNGGSIPPGSLRQTSLRLPTQAQARVSNPRPIGLNDATIFPVSSGQTRLLFPTQAHVSNHGLIRLYDAPPNGYPLAQSSFPPASVWPRTSAAETPSDQASSSRPSLPSSPVPASVPTMLPTSPQPVWSLPPAPLVPANFPEVPPSFPAAAPVPPSPPREQGEMERAAYMQSFENFLMPDDDDFYLDDDDFNLDALMAPVPYVTGIINGEQHWENVPPGPPPVLTNQPSGTLNVPDPQNGLTMSASEHGSNSLNENVAPQVHATSPSVSLPAWSQSMNRLNGPYYQHMLPEGIAPPVHATLPSDNLSSNFQNGLGSSNVPPPATSLFGCLQGGAHFQNIVPSDNIPPPVAPSGPNHQNDQQQLGNALPSASQLGWPNPQIGLQQGAVPANVPSGSSDLFNNSTTYEEKQRLLEQMGFGTVPSWYFNSADLPPGNLQE